MRSRTQFRVAFAAVVLVSVLFLAVTNASAASENPYAPYRSQGDVPMAERDTLADPTSGVTVVTSHRQGDIVALAPDGRILYQNATHDGYFDVDPSPEGARTVIYAAGDEIESEDCNPVGGDVCYRQYVERVNLTTGEVTTLYTRVDPRKHASEWHDVDRLSPDRFVVADMYADEVFVVNTTTGLVSWEWSAQGYEPLSAGGPYPGDWIHLNDVEVLPDGRIMASLRNLDQVVFIEPGTGVDHEWTLGTDDNHTRLYEQHNPDYIPASRGGPAVVIADSESNRILEYQRENGEWRRTWRYQDSRIQWPRDADRLPTGHTLVSDSHGNRVFEVNRSGDVVWSFRFPTPYEAERLDTGDESTGGPSATQASLQSRRPDPDGGGSGPTSLTGRVKQFVPNKIENGIANVVPVWVGFVDLVVLLGLVLTLLVWAGFEARPYLSRIEIEFSVGYDRQR